jgi:hypothetical protein
MRIHGGSPETQRAVATALTRVDEQLRARVLGGDIVFVATGRKAHGIVIPRPVVEGATWIVALSDFAPDALSTALHELGHVVHEHTEGGPEAEVAACTFARDHGGTGWSADPVGLQKLYAAVHAAVPGVRGAHQGGEVALRCECGAQCEVTPLIVVGADAEVLASCRACDSARVVRMATFMACPQCKQEVNVTWADCAVPVLESRCEACMAVSVESIATGWRESAGPREVVEAVRVLRRAAASVARSAHYSAEAAVTARASAVGAFGHARGLLRRSDALNGQREQVYADIGRALAALDAGDLSASVTATAAALATLHAAVEAGA